MKNHIENNQNNYIELNEKTLLNVSKDLDELFINYNKSFLNNFTKYKQIKSKSNFNSDNVTLDTVEEKN